MTPPPVSIPLTADPADLDEATIAQLRQVLDVQVLASEITRLTQGGVPVPTGA